MATDEKETAKEVKQSTPKTTAKAPEPQVELMATRPYDTWSYLGPYLPSIGLRPGNYTSGFPAPLRPLYDKLYQIRALTMPVLESLEASRGVRKPYSFEWQCYKDLEEMVKRGEI